MKWKTLNTETVVNAEPFFKITKNKIQTNKGQVFDNWYRMEGHNFVVVVPITANDEIVMVNQYRYGIEDFSLEIPAGSVDPEDADDKNAAIRELKEETGYGVKSLEKVGPSLAANPAFNTNTYTIWIGHEAAAEGDQDLDEGEDISVHLVPFDTAVQLALAGGIFHSPSVVGILRTAFTLGRLPQLS